MSRFANASRSGPSPSPVAFAPPPAAMTRRGRGRGRGCKPRRSMMPEITAIAARSVPRDNFNKR